MSWKSNFNLDSYLFDVDISIFLKLKQACPLWFPIELRIMPKVHLRRLPVSLFLCTLVELLWLLCLELPSVLKVPSQPLPRQSLPLCIHSPLPGDPDWHSSPVPRTRHSLYHFTLSHYSSLCDLLPLVGCEHLGSKDLPWLQQPFISSMYMLCNSCWLGLTVFTCQIKLLSTVE